MRWSRDPSFSVLPPSLTVPGRPLQCWLTLRHSHLPLELAMRLWDRSHAQAWFQPHLYTNPRKQPKRQRPFKSSQIRKLSHKRGEVTCPWLHGRLGMSHLSVKKSEKEEKMARSKLIQSIFWAPGTGQHRGEEPGRRPPHRPTQGLRSCKAGVSENKDNGNLSRHSLCQFLPAASSQTADSKVSPSERRALVYQRYQWKVLGSDR